MYFESLTLSFHPHGGKEVRRRSERVDLGERERGERDSLVICISIPSTACAVRQPVCPNKQPAEGGCLIITSPSFFSPGVHIPSDHKHQGQGCGLALCLRWSLEMLAGLVKQHCSCCSVQVEDSAEQGGVLGEVRGGLSVSLSCALLWGFFDWRPLQPDASSGGGNILSPLRCLLVTCLPPSLPGSLSLRIPMVPEGDTLLEHQPEVLKIQKPVTQSLI